jgi:hypothetical protein
MRCLKNGTNISYMPVCVRSHGCTEFLRLLHPLSIEQTEEFNIQNSIIITILDIIHRPVFCLKQERIVERILSPSNTAGVVAGVPRQRLVLSIRVS